MYVKTKCSKCQNEDYHNLRLYRKVSTSELLNVEVTDTVSEEELARCIVCEMRDYMHNGMTTDEFCKILKANFGVAARYCCDLIQKMKIELDMYCPDHRHLYFVDA